MDKVGIRTIVVNFDDEQLPYLSLVQGDAKTRGFDIVICDSDGKEIAPSDDYVVELVATSSNAPDKPYANRHTIKDGKYRVMIPTEALSESGFVFLQLVFYQKSTGAVIHTIEQKCPVYRSRGQEVVESNNLYVDITALRLGIEKIEVMETTYLQVLEDEETRKSSENTRIDNEQTRVEAETQRVDSEAIRKSNENTRVNNENLRVTAEEEREIKFDEWDKTIQGVIPNATDTEKGAVKISSLESETEPYTAVSIGKLEDTIAPLLFNSNIPFNEIVDNKFYMEIYGRNIRKMVEIEDDEEKMNTLLQSKYVKTLQKGETVEGKFLILKGECYIWGDDFEEEDFFNIIGHEMFGYNNLIVSKIYNELGLDTVYYYDLVE